MKQHGDNWFLKCLKKFQVEKKETSCKRGKEIRQLRQGQLKGE